jgi:hypothetical protein
MNIAIVFLLLICLGLMLAWAVLSIVQNVTDKEAYGEPAFREQGPIFHAQHVEQYPPKSQFAWQSRSHFRAPN